MFGNNANLYEDPQSSSQGGQGQQGVAAVAGPTPGVVPQNDFTGTGAIGGGAPYPAAGRPQAPTSFGSTGQGATNYPTGPSSYQPSSGSSPYPPASGPSSFPSTQGPYPAAVPNVPNVPSSSYQPPQTGFATNQNDAPYPAAGQPPRDYLPPRRG